MAKDSSKSMADHVKFQSELNEPPVLEEFSQLPASGQWWSCKRPIRFAPVVSRRKGRSRPERGTPEAWKPTSTPEEENSLHAPLDGSIHSFQDNAIPGDYGPTIILEHEIDGVNFYTLYGHLSRDSLKFLEVGQQISRGEPIAKLGKMEENGGWFPHLHFQVMTDIMSFRGDFPAVVPTRTLEEWKEILLNPMPLVFVYGRSGVTPASFSQKDELWKLKKDYLRWRVRKTITKK